MLHARDLPRDLVQVPLVARAGQPAPDLVGQALAEFEAALPPVDPPRGSTVADRDAVGGHRLIDVSQAQGKAEGAPDRVADALGREAMAGKRWPA